MNTYLHMASVALLLCASCANQLPLGSPGKPIVIAHRGDSKVAPENTLAAFRSAVKARACYVELDARSSANGTLYVLHDKTLDRTTDAKAMFNREKVAIAELPDNLINLLDAGKWFDPRFAGERLPTLAEALDVIQAGSMTLLEHKAGTAEAYAKLLRDKQLVGKLVVQSFDWDFLADLHKLQPTQTLGALGDKELTDERLAKIAASGAAVVGWNYKDLTSTMIADLHRRSYKVWAWTADEPADWDRLIADRIDGIITNCPAQLAQHLQQQPLATR